MTVGNGGHCMLLLAYPGLCAAFPRLETSMINLPGWGHRLVWIIALTEKNIAVGVGLEFQPVGNNTKYFCFD